jgi:hypothetical protein
MMVGYENIGEMPVLLCKGSEDGGCFRRVDRRRCAISAVMDEDAEIVGETHKLMNFEHAQGPCEQR